ncbi:MAG: hypothetical protein ACI8X5_000695 [Planctomycetota bacterium]|jgi:hypothetical protein
MKNLLRHTALIGPLTVLLASAATWAQLKPGVSESESRPILIPFTPAEVRVLNSVETAVFFYTPDDSGIAVHLEGLTVSCLGDVIYSTPLAHGLLGDPRFGEISALIERLPHGHRDGFGDKRWYADPDAADFEGSEIADTRREVALRLQGLEEEYSAGRTRPYVQLNFPLHLDQVFAADEPAGTAREIQVQVRWTLADGAARVATISSSVRRLAAPLAVPNSVMNAATGSTIHSGDLHVHSCHGESSGACAPSSNCTAETLQTSGSFSYAQLRSQYQALGMDWFTATDHSYCINSTGEYNAIVAECVAQTDANFLCMPDIELSSDEVGSQSGSDLGDILCLGFTSANHMGAHQLSARISGGDSGLLGFCDGLFSDALSSFTSNISNIRSQGGYPIAHHPDSGEFGWNSISATNGIEADALQGVEIWNGSSQSGQGSHVAQWVNWLLDGRLLYAYSGSDTHDQAFAFGSNNVILGAEAFSIESVHAALRSGQHYISNGHVLIMEAQLGGSTIPMGSMHPLPPGSPMSNYMARVHYNFGADTSTITIFSGRDGDSNESTLCQSGPLTGQGVYECATTLETGVNSWVRAYSASGSMTAYTNPIFFLPSGDDPSAYCTAKVNSAGCAAQIASSGSASATSPTGFDVTASDVLNNRNGILFYGLAPAFNPFSDGTLCVSAPLVRTSPQDSGGNTGAPDCSGNFSFDFNALIQGGGDASLVVGTQVYAQYWYRDPATASASGLTNALYFSIAP